MKRPFPVRAATLLVLFVSVMAGCATAPQADRDPRDPYEPVNRATFKFNQTLDKAVLQPTARAYVKVVPDPARNCVGNFFSNVSDVWTSVNDLAQGKAREASSDVCRVAVNTTVGVFGCFDVASGMGFVKRKEDFGQTLGRYGLRPGPYLVLPILGSSTLRDSLATIVDVEADPVSHLNNIRLRNSLEVLRIVDARAGLLGAGRLLEGASLDEYVFVRDAYLARRRSQIYDGNPPDDDDMDDPSNDSSSSGASPSGNPPSKTDAVKPTSAEPDVAPPPASSKQ